MMTMALTAVLLGEAPSMISMAAVVTAGAKESSTSVLSSGAQQIGPGGQVTVSGGDLTDETSPESDVDFDVRRFALPADAGMLVLVEGTGGADCMVYAYEKTDEGWKRAVQTYGYLGINGMSYDRQEGDKTTPTGLFRLNTPFGQKDALDGFPSDYLKVSENHQWRMTTNQMDYNPSGFDGDGEAVGTHWYREYYNYALDFGYNLNAVAGRGSALFLHCIGQGKKDTSGCVAIPEEQMIAIMRMYGSAGNGNAYIALAPQGKFDTVYEAFGVNDGLSPRL
jgi:L,D-peptidoglycan transpeptidase YkuD (ErfK/YbiS/YcfS/YnhG family)